MNDKSNGRAIGTDNSLAETMSPEQQRYNELLEFERNYKKGTRNVFVYAPERINVRQLLAGSQNIAGAFYGVAPDQYSYTTLTGSKTRKLGEDPRSVTLDLNYTLLPNYQAFSDTSLGNFSTRLYLTIVNIFPESYITSGVQPLFPVVFEPLLVIDLGIFAWKKSLLTYEFRNFNTNLDLKSTIPNRGITTLSGTNYPDFVVNPAKLTQDQYSRFIVEGNRPLAVSLAFDATGLAPNDSAFLASNFYGQASIAFNYYALLANF